MDSADHASSVVLLARLAKLANRRSGEESLGMRLRYFVALSYLRDHPHVPQQQICDTLCIDPNNVVLLLNALEADGLVQRRRDPADRRRHLVELTAAGARALGRAERAQATIEDEILAPLSARERVTLRELLARVLANDDPPATNDDRPEATAAA
ncbi:MAG: MarR family winged helix-turn-helix transcriptional regulator [Solirubrobacteraceae bacterium]|jgi:DNA-binding MarR family transcriptional regulator